ncbi:hypothetical protein DICVIV_10734 [Dictyocaulus viviparus]|uniref:Uncharacterized protein n=1 Tax=Dictyocaulus viviparus TaxID=29172 RepID=A0A0D8XHP6_DICVI|nr:hypothetical protein DICVIV_10734 [Dictyocaulus viviparus]
MYLVFLSILFASSSAFLLGGSSGGCGCPPPPPCGCSPPPIQLPQISLPQPCDIKSSLGFVNRLATSFDTKDEV